MAVSHGCARLGPSRASALGAQFDRNLTEIWFNLTWGEKRPRHRRCRGCSDFLLQSGQKMRIRPKERGIMNVLKFSSRLQKTLVHGIRTGILGIRFPHSASRRSHGHSWRFCPACALAASMLCRLIVVAFFSPWTLIARSSRTSASRFPISCSRNEHFITKSVKVYFTLDSAFVLAIFHSNSSAVFICRNDHSKCRNQKVLCFLLQRKTNHK